jgi:DNA-directed RNA polymerase subunit RPC12/RpoP
MADFTFNCSECNQLLEASDEMRGEVIECPACQKEIQIPAAESAVEPVVEPEEKASGNKCPSCGAEMAAGVVLCFQCGFHTKLGKKIATDFK